MSLKKEDLITHVAHENGITKIAARQAVDSMLEFIMSANENGEQVQLVGFGSFSPVKRAERIGTHPITKEKIVIESAFVPKFKAGKTYRSRLKH